MRVTCPHCHTKAIITSSNRLTEAVTDLYCQCMNTKDCGASFVFTLAYKHNLNPPKRSTQELAISLLKSLSIADRKKLQVDLFT